jgi:hypothetical protein
MLFQLQTEHLKLFDVTPVGAPMMTGGFNCCSCDVRPSIIRTPAEIAFIRKLLPLPPAIEQHK